MPTDRRGHTKRDETPLGLRRRETRPGQARGASEPHTRRAGGVPGLGGVGGGAFQGTECQCGGGKSWKREEVVTPLNGHEKMAMVVNFTCDEPQ